MTKPFLPNGCTASPDGIGAVEHKRCCDLHDLAYYLGGSVWQKWKADWGLASCMAERWVRSVQEPVPWWRRVGRALGAITLPPAYFLVTASVGLLPTFWNYQGNPMPTHEELAALASWRKA